MKATVIYFLFFSYSKEEIENKVTSYRNMLMESDSGKKSEIPRNEFGRME